MTRTTGSMILIVLVLILSASAAASIDWSASWGEKCGGCCVENHTVNFTIEIENTGDEGFLLDAVRVELRNGTVVAGWDKVDGHGKDLDPDDDKSVVAKGRLPVFNDSEDAYYRACIYMVYNSTLLGSFSNWSCSSDLISMDVVNRSVYICDSDNNCSADQYCDIEGCQSECVNITPASSCGNFTNHRWVDYGCCSDSDCGSSQACVEHYCVNITCPCGQITSHGCVAYECCSDSACGSGEFCSREHVCEIIECQTDEDCASDKVCEGRKCKAVECGGCAYPANHGCKNYECCDDSSCANDEACEGHTCQGLSCAPLGYASAHVCIAYECISNDKCADNESCQDHECVSVECPANKNVKNHACVPLGCSIIDYAKEHRCVSYFSSEGVGDNPIPVIAILILGVAIAFLVKHFKRGTIGLPRKETVERDKKGRRVHKKGASDDLMEDKIVELAKQTAEETKAAEESEAKKVEEQAKTDKEDVTKPGDQEDASGGNPPVTQNP